MLFLSIFLDHFISTFTTYDRGKEEEGMKEIETEHKRVNTGERGEKDKE